MRCAAPNVAMRPGELLPRLFTLTGLAGGYFLSHLLCRYRQLPVRKHGALCCPDFPPAAHMSVGDTIGRAPCSPALSAKVAIFAYLAKYYGLYQNYCGPAYDGNRLDILRLPIIRMNVICYRYIGYG